MPDQNHVYLVLPGPVEVRKEVLEAQTAWMIGHRSADFADLFAEVQGKLRKAFLTEHRVYTLGASGSGFWETASRNCVRGDKKALHLTCGAFGEKWANVSQSSGKQVDLLSVEWGRGHTAESVDEALKKGSYDAVFVVHNESSTGVINPLKEIGEVVSRYEDTLFVVDAVSSFAGAELRTDDWQIDFVLTSSQKAFALPPGLALAAVSDRVLERAGQIEDRGYYFDLLEMEKRLLKNNTPSTPPVSLLFAANYQLDDILAEGMEARWARHLQMRDRTIEWAENHGFGFYAAENYRSPTLTAVANTRAIDVNEMAAFMLSHGYAMDRGYGKIKGETFRIPHMGDMQPETLEKVLQLLDEFLQS